VTLTRDIRLTDTAIIAIRDQSRRRVREMEKRLERNTYEGKPGMKSTVLRERDVHQDIAETMEVARKTIAYQLAGLLLTAEAAAATVNR
jgi:hypothetical protein